VHALQRSESNLKPTSSNEPPPLHTKRTQKKGFNAIRLPFIFRDLKAPATTIGGYCTGAHSLQELAERTVAPHVNRRKIAAQKAPAPVVPLPDISGPGTCNSERLGVGVGFGALVDNRGS